MVNIYCRPTAVILLTPRRHGQRTNKVSRGLPTYPPNYIQKNPQQGEVQSRQDPSLNQVQNVEAADVHVSQWGGKRAHCRKHDSSDNTYTSYSVWADRFQTTIPIQLAVQLGFPFHFVHSQNILLVPTSV